MITYTFTATLPPDFGSESILTNTVVVTTPPGVTDVDERDNQSTARKGLIPKAELYVDKTVSDLRPNQGDLIVYTLEVGNDGGPSDVIAELTDVLPAGLAYDLSLIHISEPTRPY